MPEYNPQSRPAPWFGLTGIAVLALIIRLSYLYLAIGSLGLDALFRYAPDTGTYLTVANHLLHGDPQGPYALFRVGPGYGGMLAGIQLLFGESQLAPLIVNVLFGALAPLAVGLLAWELVGKRWLALGAALITALSHTSVTLSCLALTDQPAFTLQAFTLVAFARGLNTTRISWFVIAGFLGATSLFIRPSVQFWPYLLIAVGLVIPRRPTFPSRLAMVIRAAVPGLIMLVALYGWSLRNYVVHERFTFGSNGMLTMRGCLLAQARMMQFSDSTIGILRRTWALEDSEQVGDPVVSLDRASERFRITLRTNWRGLLLAYYRNLSDNIKVGDAFLQRQVPALRPVGAWLNDQTANWFGMTLVYLTAAGVIVLWLQGYRAAPILLGGVYLYATVMVGLSFWQGSRLHYPAEMAWVILAPATVGGLVTWIRKVLAGR